MSTNKHGLDNKKLALLELVKSGLFQVRGEEFFDERSDKVDYLDEPSDKVERIVNDAVDWNVIYSLAEAQGVTGLVAAGIERLNVQVPLEVKLQFVGSTLQVEQRNKAMDAFIADIVERMRTDGIFTLLVKGQGVAQCYEKPLWRPSGDVDFLLSEDNYKKAKDFLLPLSSGNKDEERYSQHLGMSIGEWYVEIHGSLRTGLSERIDRMVDAVQNSVFYGGNVRSWQNGKTQVFLPAPTEDVFLVFTHFIKHFYKEGMSLRQVCDWCRLLYTYREKLDYGLLEKWIKKSGLMQEWKGFAAVAVEYLGMPETAMPFFNLNDDLNLNKTERLVRFILNGSHGRVKDTCEIAKIFPWHTIKFLPSIFLNVNGLKIKERLFF